ncbi:hypothetical protein [Metabacillus bambusae]|uniref:Uncharacterized protein n=1 Tax=Metabacillus bambusae TaxID=2795218 RepID=A0ABS3MZU4_9BACI|nr:hypothetical protein [Metabacillus bambusae]MBO1511546.1 hypothetical protein [Metabacillus bambusae]
MVNIRNNYKSLLVEYEKASELYQETGLTRLLAHAMENLERFERSFIELYSFEKLCELQEEFQAQGLLIV